MKIAAVTDDGITLSEHFGQATRYVVMTVVEDRVVNREERAKPACEHHHGADAHDGADAHEHHHDHAQAQESAHGTDTEDEGPDLHTRMTNVIADCEAVIVRGVPRPMYQHLVSTGIRPLITSIPAIDDAMDAYLAAAQSEQTAH
jgi:predicted Fe-Mo cluster-binding NifX family protein